MRWIFDFVSAIARRRRQRKRELLRYFDGRRWRYGDPFALYRAIAAHPTLNLEAQAPLIDLGQEPETSIAVEAIAEVFGLQRWNAESGAGLTDWEILDCLEQLNRFLLGVKKNTNGQPISSPPTESASSTGPEAPGEATNS